MAFEKLNGVRIRYELSGIGTCPLVLVHGSWGSHQQWDGVAAGLGTSFRVLSYDRRGHSESEAPSGQGSVHEDMADLAALIEHFELAPAYVAANSFGASITLRLAGERPELFRGLMLHEPPLFSLVADDPSAAANLEEVRRTFPAVIEKIRSGDHAGAAALFMGMALEQGAWERLPQGFKQTAIDNAPTFLDEAMDPEQLAFDPASIRNLACPALLTIGDQSPPMYAPVLEKLARTLPRAERLTFQDAGHLPHVTHPNAYVEATAGFIRKHEGRCD